MKKFFCLCLSIFAVLSVYAEGDTITTKSGLKYVKLREGNGKMPNVGSKVKVHYKGTLLDGSQFDSSYETGSPFQFKVGNKEVIPGWDQGIQLMSEGEKGVLIVPAILGYGKRGVKDEDNPKRYLIPPDATLIFEMELLKVK